MANPFELRSTCETRRGSWLAGHRNLEGNVFVGDFWACGGAAAEGILGGSGVIEVVASAAAGATACSGTCGHAIALSAYEPKITCDYFVAGALLAFLVLPFSGLYFAFYINQGTLL